jgi:hypothetical protein
MPFHVLTGSIRVLIFQSHIYFPHLAEDIPVRDYLTERRTPQASAAIMKIIQKLFQNRILGCLKNDSMRAGFNFNQAGVPVPAIFLKLSDQSNDAFQLV